MLLDFPSITETSTILNPTVPSGSADPVNPSIGELFYRTTTGSLEIYTGAVWSVAGAGVVASHAADSSLHLSPAQNTLLDNISSISAAEINHLDGVTSNIQTQFNTLSSTLTSHTSSTALHLSTAQNTFLDALNLPTLTAAQVNHLVGVTSNVQDQLDDIVAVNSTQATTLTSLQSQINANDTAQTNALNTHIASTTLHISAAQNTFLDGLNLPTLTATQVNHLIGVSSNVQDQFTAITTNRLHRNGSVTMTGDLNLGGFRVIGLGTPVNPSDAVNKQYVDDVVSGLSWKQAVVAATTTNIALSGTQTIDGVVVGVGQRVMVKNQTAAYQNGIYICASTAWSRAPDAETSVELDGAAVFVQAGTINADSAWIQVTNSPVIGTSPISWSRFAASGGASPGNGIDITGSVISVANGPGLTFTGGDLTLDISSDFAFSGSDLILANSGVVSGTYGSGSLIPVVSVDAKGRVTSITTATPTGYQASNAFLTALTTTGSGIQVKTGTTTAAARTIDWTGNGISVTNGNGISGNPTINSSAVATNTPSTIVFRDGTGSFAASTITANLIGSVDGNATTATTLQTARTINGVSFNGSANISIDAPTPFLITFNNGGAGGASGTTFDGSVARTISYNTIGAPSATGTGASGTWGISISGNAATATTLQTARTINGVSFNGSANISINAPTPQNLTFVNNGTGAASGTTFDGSVARTISYNTVGAPSAGGAGASGTWSINISGNAATATTASSTSGNANTATTLATARSIGLSGVTATAQNFDGSGNISIPITAIPASLLTGTIADARISGSYTGLTNITGSGTATFGTFSGSGASLTALNASQLTSGTVPDARISGAYTGITTLSTTSNITCGGTFRGSDGTAGAPAFNFNSDPNTGMFRSAENVIGWATGGTQRLTLDGSGNLTATGNVTAFSDARIKRDVTTIADALLKVQAIRGVTYSRVDEENGPRHAGVIAQEVEQVLPEVVSTGPTGMKSVAYGNLVALLIEAVKELSQEVQDLKAQLDRK